MSQKTLIIKKLLGLKQEGVLSQTSHLNIPSPPASSYLVSTPTSNPCSPLPSPRIIPESPAISVSPSDNQSSFSSTSSSYSLALALAASTSGHFFASLDFLSSSQSLSSPSLSDIPALVDSGASHNFIEESLAKR